MIYQTGRKLLAGFTALVIFMGMTMSEMNVWAQTNESTNAVAPSRVTVHDPSIIKANNMYYVFGSHMADAKSTDLIDWQQMNPDYSAREGDSWKQDSVFGDVVTNLAESFRWAGYDDADCSNGRLAVWAPDVIYNPNYEWGDSQDNGAYMIYYSASSTWKRSCIGYAVSKNVEGPYQYVDTVIYSGFSNNPKSTDSSDRNVYWDNDYLNIRKLIDSGVMSGVNEKWFRSSGIWESNYCPNAIDPTIFFDKEGKMYMLYGSWSGGLFVQSLDSKTGAVNYPGEDGVESTSGNVTDRYFGTRISGGDSQSGEGGYIIYDKASDYYYLYESYGGLTKKGGYNIRLFRSKNVYGPYLDSSGKNAKDSSQGNESYGIKLMGNYKFSDEPGYYAAGHNSALIDEDGSHFLVYHQRFEANDTHEVRVHQQFMNEDNWPVTAVYEYRGEKIGHYKTWQVTGNYEIINHGTKTDGNLLPTQSIVLLKDGTVSGDVSGTWRKTTVLDKEYDYITITINGTTYKGILFEQYNEKSSQQKVMTFSAIADDNTSLWGTCQTATNNKEIYNSEEYVQPMATPTATPTTLPTASGSPTETMVPSSKDQTTGSLTTTPASVCSTPARHTATAIIIKTPIFNIKAGKKRASLCWKKVTGASGYQIQYGAKKSLKKAKKIIISKPGSRKKIITGLKKGTRYYFRIRAFKKNSGKKIWSKYSKTISCKIK